MTANLADYRRPISQEEAVSRDRTRRLPVHGEYGSQHEAKGYLKRRHRQKAGLMRQFIKQADGPCGNTNEFRAGWERIFGRNTKIQAAYAEGGRDAATRAEAEQHRAYLGKKAWLRNLKVDETRGPARPDTPEERQRAKQMAAEQAAGLADAECEHATTAALYAERQRQERETAEVLGEIDAGRRREATEAIIREALTPAESADAYASNFEQIDWGKR
jgi:hypothetical protein